MLFKLGCNSSDGHPHALLGLESAPQNESKGGTAADGRSDRGGRGGGGVAMVYRTREKKSGKGLKNGS